LEFLYLFSNVLTGPIPSTISGCSALLFFDASSNQLVGTIPEVLPSSLVLFVVADCLFTGMVLSCTCPLMGF
jgi:hypothetical protein